MPKLQRQTQKIGGKEYSKWVFVIPESVIKSSHLKEGDELIAESLTKNKIILEKK